jgi:amino acid adenylation domain-containing protein/non-ribosomal peptide synthase protein (TIGR01720 family)
MNEHRALINRLLWMQDRYQLSHQDRVLQKTPFSFDVSVWEFFWTLLNGACLVVARPQGHQDPDYLRRLIEETEVTTLHFVPSMLQVFLDQHRVGQCRSLQRIVCSGEEFPASLQRKFFERLSCAQVHNLYGPTEAAIDVTAWECWPDDQSSRVPIGRPIWNTQLYVLDEHLEAVPIGAIGELNIGGAGVGRGYVNRPGLTAERFVADPYGTPGSRLYRTGDCVRYRADGNLQFIGRMDDQVKIRGFRIELGEVEATLLAHPRVRQAAVVARVLSATERQLVGYVVAESESALSVSELRAHMLHSLPEYMVPAALMMLPELPLTSSGKVDRKALPDPTLIEQQTYVAPRTPTEEVLAQIWLDVLHAERVGIEDNFFTLGGHSLLAMQVMARVRESFSVELPLRSLFEVSTVRALAGQIEQARHAEQGWISVPLVARPVDQRSAPLSFGQERLWFLEQLEVLGSTYHAPIALRLRGQLDEQALSRSVAELIRRHEILRTRIVMSAEGQGLQVIDVPGEFSLHSVSVCTEAEAHALIESEALRRFDLSQVLLRVCLVRLGPEDHVLLLVMHHLICDGWSLSVLMREWVALYQAYREGRPSPLPELEVQYADYALWQRKWLQGTVLDRQLTYWREQLSEMPAALELPTDRLRPGTPSFKGAQHGFTISKECVRGLSELSRREGVTLYMVLLAALQVVLGRWSGQSDVAVGSPIAGRTYRKTEGLIGFFVNTLVLRTDLSGDPTFAELLGRVKEVALGAYAHQELPFEKLVAELQPQRDLSRQALYQVTFTFQNFPQQRFELGELQITPFPCGRPSIPFDLSWYASETPGGLQGVVEYATDLFDASTVEHLVESFECLLTAVVQNAEQRISQLPLMGEAQKLRLLVKWNATARAFPEDRCIHELFAEQAARTPQAIAVRYEDLSLTYQQLEERANQLAHHLIALGVGPEVIVGLCVERSLEMVVGLLGILKAGGAYLPLDPSYPQQRLAFMIEDADPALILTQTALNDCLYESQPRLCVDNEWAYIAAQPTKPPSSPVCSDNLVYVIYTSGSTGRPKGVGMAHRSVCNHMAWMRNRFPLTECDIVLQKTPLSFDASVWEVFMPLLSGAQLNLAQPQGHRDPAYLCRATIEGGISTLQMVPSMLQLLIAQAELRDLITLKHLFSGGETLSVGLRDCVLQELSSELHNLYGPTEACIQAAAYTCRPGDPSLQALSVPIGRPVWNTQFYVLDDELELVPVGALGELYIGGVQVARGYVKRAGLTAERFIANPFGVGDRLYRTGDLVRYYADGNLQFMRRVDDQVKIRGFRIELGEIESVLLTHPEVQQAVVVAREDSSGERRLVSYVTCVESVRQDSGARGSVSELREYIKDRLPEYMIPSAFVVLDTLPLTVNGKVDRKNLPADDESSRVRRRYEAPQGEVEKKLAQIWQEVLRVERVGRHDNFFELGGHSLQTVSVIERMQHQGLRADVRTLFTASSLAELASTVDSVGNDALFAPPNQIPDQCEHITPQMLPLVELEQDHINRITESVPGGAANVQDIYPLAPLQEGILFHHLINTRGDAYLVKSLLSFDTRDRLERFLAAFQSVVNRHYILRTGIFWEGLPEPVQVVRRRAQLEVAELALEPMGGDAAEQLMKCSEIRCYRMNVSKAPLMAVYVAHDSAKDRWLLVLLNHHIVTDHTTLAMLHREIAAYLVHRGEHLPPPLPFREFVAQSRLTVSRAEHERFFRELLGDLRQSTAPFELTDVHGDGSGVEQIRWFLDKQLARKLRACARAQLVSVASICHVAWAQVLARVSGSDDVIFGTVLLGRLHAGIGSQRALGLFINTLPVRIRVQSQTTQESVREMHGLLAKLLRHEHASLVLAQRCSGIAPPKPLFNTLLNYRHSPRAEPDAESMSQAFEGIQWLWAEEHTNYPTTVSIDDLGEDFELTVQSSLNAQRIGWFMEQALKQLVEALESAPWKSVNGLDVLPLSERRQLLTEWNATARAYPQDRCIHELVTEQAMRTPNAIAVLYNELSLTYRQLDERANQLAHHLIALGVGPEVIVGLCAERSLEMVVGLLGIWKAGGAYLPLDPAHPQQRVAFMLEDTRTPVLLTSEDIEDRLPAVWVRTVCLDRDWPEIAEQPKSPPIAGVASDNLAYVIYTSGSTGQPKAVLLQHQGLCNLADVQACGFDVQPDSRVLQFASLSFDASVSEIVMTLRAGATLCIPGKDMSFPSLEFGQYLNKQAVSIATLPPSVLPFVEQPRSLRTLVVAGEACGIDLAKKWAPHCRFINAYGPTETTVCATYGAFEAGHDAMLDNVPIGRPIGNTQAYVLDEQLEPLPIGVVGELFVGGVGVGRGYLNRSGLTAERFIANPYGPSGSRLYRTGDRVRFRADGTLQFIGRMDGQVKIRGFRIELGEIEATLLAHPQVRQAAVIVQEAGQDEKRLIGYVAASEDGADSPETDSHAALSVNDLREHLKCHLPEYMVPSTFVMLRSLPLTVSGKVDRKNLPDIGDMASEAHEYEVPQGELETKLAQIWQDVLKVNRAGRHDNFFELGGNSISAIRVVSRANGATLKFSVSDVFEYPTIAQMAERGRAVLSVAAQNEHADGDMPLVPILARFAKLWPEQLRNNVLVFSIECLERVTVTLLENAFTRLVAKHDALRVSFHRVESEWRARTVPPDALEGRKLVEWLDLSGLDAQAQLAELQAVRSGLASRIDISSPPLACAILCERGEVSPQQLLVAIHHSAIDPVSNGILIQDLEAICRQLRDEDAASECIAASSFKNWVVRLAEYGKSPQVIQEASYWREQLSDVQISLPVDNQSNYVAEAGDHSLTFELGATETECLLRLAPIALKAQIDELLLTALAMAFGGWANRESVTIQHLRHGRVPIIPGLDIASIMGWFSMAVPIKLNTRPRLGLREALNSVKAQLGSVPNEGIGYGVLRYMNCEPTLVIREEPLVRLNHQGALSMGCSETAFRFLESFSALNDPSLIQKRTIALTTWVREQRLQAHWSYDVHAYTREGIYTVARRTLESLRALAVLTSTAASEVPSEWQLPIASMRTA